MAGGGPGGADQIGLTVIAEQVGQRERQVFEIGAKLPSGHGEHVRSAVSSGDFRRKLAQAGEASLTYDALGFFGDHTQHANDRAPIVRQGRVGKRVVGFLRVAAALQEKQKPFVPSCLATLEHVRSAGRYRAKSLSRPHGPMSPRPTRA
jgi:hypothetical protein